MEVNATLLVQLALFVLLLTWLSRFLLAPLLALFDERERRTNGVAATASELNRQAAARTKKVEQALSAARLEAAHVAADFQQQAQRHREHVLAQAKQQARQLANTARHNLTTHTSKLEQQLEHQQEDLVRELAHCLAKPAATALDRQAASTDKTLR